MRQVIVKWRVFGLAFLLLLAGLAGCAGVHPPAPRNVASPDYNYLIGPLDTLSIIVWRNQDLSMSVPVPPRRMAGQP